MKRSGAVSFTPNINFLIVTPPFLGINLPFPTPSVKCVPTLMLVRTIHGTNQIPIDFCRSWVLCFLIFSNAAIILLAILLLAYVAPRLTKRLVYV
jgi:hypothetical protein